MTSFENRRSVKIAWGDCDAAGIVFYPRYFEMFDEATTELFAAADFHMPDLMKGGNFIGWPMVNTSANFKIPSRYGDLITIVSKVVSWRRTSFFVEHRVLRGGDLSIEAQEHRVWAGHDEQGGLCGQRAPDHIIKKMYGAPAA